MPAPSLPSLCDLHRDGYRIVERLRPTPFLRHSPTRTCHVAVDRVVGAPPGSASIATGLLFRRGHPSGSHDCLATDLVRPRLSDLGFGLQALLQERDGHLDVVVDGCPGVRLRVLADVTVTAGAHFPRPLFQFVAQRTEELSAVFARYGVAVEDTFIGFDGSVHLFPALPRTVHHEEVTADVLGAGDTLVLRAADVTAQRMPGASSGWQMTTRGPQPVPTSSPFHADVPLDDDRTRRRDPDLQQWLGQLAVSLCPAVHERHQRLADEAGVDLNEAGLQRELAVLQAPGPLSCISGLTLHRTRSHAFALEDAPVTLAQLRRVLPELVDAHPGPPEAEACGVSLSTAMLYAARIGRRLPTADEWTAAAIEVPENHPWQLTSTSAAEGGVVVYGGRWRNRQGAALTTNQSWEDAPASDVGFRCVVDVSAIRGDVDDADFFAGTRGLPR